MKWIGVALVAAIPLGVATVVRVRRNRLSRKGRRFRRALREVGKVGDSIGDALRRLPIARALR